MTQLPLTFTEDEARQAFLDDLQQNPPPHRHTEKQRNRLDHLKCRCSGGFASYEIPGYEKRGLWCDRCDVFAGWSC